VRFVGIGIDPHGRASLGERFCTLCCFNKRFPSMSCATTPADSLSPYRARAFPSRDKIRVFPTSGWPSSLVVPHQCIARRRQPQLAAIQYITRSHSRAAMVPKLPDIENGPPRRNSEIVHIERIPAPATAPPQRSRIEQRRPRPQLVSVLHRIRPITPNPTSGTQDESDDASIPQRGYTNV